MAAKFFFGLTLKPRVRHLALRAYISLSILEIVVVIIKTALTL